MIRSRKMKDLKHLAIAIMLGLALLAQLMNPTRAYADGETTPQPSEAPLETSTSEPTDLPTEAAATEPAATDTLSSTPEPIATDIAPTEPPTTDPGLSTPVSTEVILTDPASPTGESVETATPIPPTDSTSDLAATPVSEATAQAEEPSLGEVLQELSGDTTVIVLDENGQSEPLATQAAADIVANSDPMWCPDGVAPGGIGCTPNFFSMADLLAFAGSYINNQNVNGTIWITSGTVADVNAVGIDGSTYTNWANYGLTLQGGWSGINGDSSIGSNSVFFVPITIANWNNDVTLNNITTTSSIGIINDPWGSTTNQIGNVTVDNVTASHLNVTTNSSGNTIHIRNSSFSNGNSSFINGQGAYIDGWLNNLIIENSHFDNNAGDGLVGFNSSGGITIMNSTFNGNAGNGAAIYYAGDVTL